MFINLASCKMYAILDHDVRKIWNMEYKNNKWKRSEGDVETLDKTMRSCEVTKTSVKFKTMFVSHKQFIVEQ